MFRGFLGMSTFFITVVVGGVALAVLVFFVQSKLMKLRRVVENNWKPLERHLERRNEIVRKLAETADPALANDPNTIDDVYSLLDTLNGNLTIDQHVEFENRLAMAVRRLLQVADGNYELRANALYHDYKRQLAETDLQVTQSARFYNVSAKEYNEACTAVPCVLVASSLGFGKQPYLATSLTETETPEFGR
jgi:hypothetical protein